MRKYLEMSPSAKVLLNECIKKAVKDNNRIVFKCKNADETILENQLIPGSAEYEDFRFDLKDTYPELISPFDYEKGMEMSIEVIEGAEKTVYELWYADKEEDRVYIDNIDSYLKF